ncbi:MAG: cobalamin biosynthesis protein CbiG, partial [Coriobacteriia bacterium]|nr:cobalamin biosynthesis protein CbiG [Coriobacteriia bacterium]
MRFTRTGPIAVIFVAEEGADLAARVASVLPGATLWAPRAGLRPNARVYEGTLRDFMGVLWTDHAAVVAVMAVGIVVRSIAPWVASKYDDPAVVVLDDAG